MTHTTSTANDAASASSTPRPVAAQLFAALVAGCLFGFGLAFSTMIRPEVVLGFLRMQDMGLVLVLGGAVVVTFIGYRFAPRLLRQPLLGGRFGAHESSMSRSTIVGAAIFGVGWGLTGVCPGPAIAVGLVLLVVCAGFAALWFTSEFILARPLGLATGGFGIYLLYGGIMGRKEQQDNG